MKGIVFTEFFEMVEGAFSPDMADDILEACDLPSGGIYTGVGFYDHNEIVALVGKLSEKTGQPVPALLEAFGRYLFGRFAGMHPEFFQGIGSACDFLRKVETYIHVEVRKLYPDAELPTFEYLGGGDEDFQMIYRSNRPFAHLAHGLVLGCIEHYREPLTVRYDDISGGAGTSARFTLARAA